LLQKGFEPNVSWNSLGSQLVPSDKSYTPTGVTLMAALVYDKTKVTNPPTTWQQLLSSKWKGAVGMNDPSQSGPTYPFIAGMMNYLGGISKGEAYFTKLKSNGLIVHPTNGPYPLGYTLNRRGEADWGGGSVEYAMTVRTAASFAEADARIRAALKEQGFGVLTEIDVQSTLWEKLGVEMEQYVILGACNPPLAHRALSADRTVGLLLPCNVVIRVGDGCTVVEALDPRAIAEIGGQPLLKDIAEDAAGRLRAVLATLPPES
jgi:uncharacterized protein (DUF302 family)